MRDGPSRTAAMAAGFRALHQVLDGGRIFHDDLARPILGAEVERFTEDSASWAGADILRFLIAARSRFCEDSLAAQLEAGVRQYVVLGAGLDTFGCRARFQDRDLRVFEVDHPQTQAWKRERLAEAHIAIPPSLVFAPVDLERETLAEGLARAGFDFARPAFFAWLGVTVYLTRDAVLETLRFVAERPAPSGVVFDYVLPVDTRSPEELARHLARAERAAAAGEPWVTRFRPEELAAELEALGFDEIEDLDPEALGARYGAERNPQGAHLVRAMRTR